MDRNTTADQLVEMGLDLGVRGDIFEEGVLKILNDPELDNETKAKIIGYSHCNWEADLIERIMEIFFTEKEVTHARY